MKTAPSTSNAPDNAVAKSTVSVSLDHSTPSISVVSRSLIFVIGSNVSILQPGVSRGDVRVTKLEPCGVTGDVLNMKEKHSIPFMLNGCEFKHTFLVCSFPTNSAGLVGTDFMASLGAVIDFECGKLLLTGNRKVPRVYIVPPMGHKALTIFSDGKAGRSSQVRKCEARCIDERVPASLRPEITMQERKSWLSELPRTSL